jgi:hypothetical protein
VPLSLKGSQRGEVYLEMTFFSAGPAPLTRRPTKFTNPAERLARPQPQQPVAQAQRPQQRVVSQPPPSALSPGGQAPRVHANEGSRQGHPRVQQVPLPGAWPGPSAQQRQSTQHSVSSHPNRRTSKSEDTPLPPLPQDAGPKEEFVPSILRPGGPSRMVGQPIHESRATPPDVAAHERYSVGTPSPPVANGAAGHHHTMRSDSDAYTTYPTHQATNQTTLPFPGSPIPQPHHSSSPQPQSQQHSPHLPSYSTQGTPGHVGGFSLGGHATTQPSPQVQPEITHTQYHSQPLPPPQRQQGQHSPRQQAQPPQGGQVGRLTSSYPTDNNHAQPYIATPGPPSSNQSYFATSSPTPPPPSYVPTQTASPPVPSYNSAQSPLPVSHARPYATSPTPVSFARPHSASPGPSTSVPPTHQYVTAVPPPQQYAATPVTSAQPYTAPTNSVPPAQPYVSHMGSVLSPPPQSATPSPPGQPYIPAQSPIFPPPTPPPSMPPHGPSYAAAPAPSFPVPSIPILQTTGYFESVTPAPFSPPSEPDLPDPYLLRRYQAPLPLPPGAPRPQHTNAKPKPQSTPPSSAAAGSSARGGEGRKENEDERAAREWQRWEEESARARREQEEKDEELARTLDMELNMESASQGEPDRRSHSKLPRLSTGVVGNSMPGEW